MTTNKPTLRPLSKSEPDTAVVHLGEPVRVRLTVSDGLNFGCGFWVAGVLSLIAAGFALGMLGTILGVFVR